MKYKIYNINKIPDILKFAALSLVFAAPFCVFGPYSVIQSESNVWYTSVSQSKIGALWNPNILGGIDLRSQMTYSIWEVLNLVLPSWVFSVLLVLMTYFFSTYFMYRLLHLRFGVCQVSALIGALFLLSSYVKAQPLTIAWTFLLVIFEAFFWINERRRRAITYVVAGGIGILYASMTPIHDQVFALFFAFLFMLISKRNVLIGVIPQIIVFIVGWAIIAVPALVAIHEVVPLSVRAHTRELLPSLSDLFFFCTIGNSGYRPYAQFALVLLALFATRFRNPMALKAVMYLVFFETFYIALVYLFYFLGGMLDWATGIGSSRFLFWTPFLFSFIVGLSIDAIIQSGFGVPLARKGVFKIGVIAFGLWLIYAHVLDRAYEWKTYGSFAYNSRAEIYDSINKNTEKSTPFRVSIAYSGPSKADSSLDHSGGYMHINGFETFTGFSWFGTIRQVDYWDAMTRCKTRPDMDCMKEVRHPEHFYLNLPPSKKANSLDISAISTTMLAIANVRFIVSQHSIDRNDLVEMHSPGRPSLGKLPLLERIKSNFSGRDDLYLYEFHDALPRLYVSRHVRVFDNDTELLSTLSEATINEVRDTVFLSRTDGPVKPLTSNNIPGQASFIKLNNDEFEVDVNVEGPAYLFISNSFNEGWQCTNQDGKMLQMRPAFHLFTAIMVNEEDRTITCQYSPFPLL
ncbi:MAG: hypothetical protein CMI55_01135 [Parcubacteria group bacterium]|nr:hypothetical protein [Parcubacteria group bacterium]